MRHATIFPAIAATFGLALLLYAITPHGIGLSEDLISYLSAANSLHASGDLRDIDGSWFVAWTPLYPLTIAALQFLPFKIEHALAALNLLVFVLTVISSWLLIIKTIEKTFFRVACLLFIVCSFTMMQAYAMALSEAIFLLLINLIALASCKPEVASHNKYLLLAMLCAFAMLQRYIGVFLIPVVLLLFVWKKEEKVSVGKVFVFLFLAIAPLAIWLTRNYLLTETLTGFRPSGSEFFLKNVIVIAETITSWILPIKISLIIRAIALACVFILLRKSLRESNRIHLLVFVVYVLMLVVAYFFFSFEEPRDRLLAPVFISFSILLFSGLENFSKRISEKILAVLICLWMLYPAARIIKHVQLWHHDGVDVYNKPFRNDSPTIVWLKENPLEGKIFSNDPYAIYYFTGRNAFRVPKSIYSFEQFSQSVKEGDLLVWWKDKALYDLEFISTKYSLEEKARLIDATVFRMNKL